MESMNICALDLRLSGDEKELRKKSRKPGGNCKRNTTRQCPSVTERIPGLLHAFRDFRVSYKRKLQKAVELQGM